MENLCWVCDTPFDETKPFKKESYQIEDQIEIAKDSSKNKQDPKKIGLKK